MTVILFTLGAVLLIVGAEALVRGASRLAGAAGISPLVIGLTVVAYGTSAPEVAVSVQSAFAGQADLALGNVVGSNILNILLILGVSALIAPLVVSKQLVRLDVPLLIGVSFLLFLMALDGKVSRLDGLVLFCGNLIYAIWSIRQSRKESAHIKAAATGERQHHNRISGKDWIINIGLVMAGLLLLVLGADWLVDSAVTLARALGVSDLVIGLTIVAAGTSAPEIATSIMAAMRGERDIAVGNVIGSSLFNILSVLGLTSLVAPDGVNVSPAAVRFDIPIMIAAAVACLPIFFTGHLIARWEGALFLGYYGAYTLYIVLAAIHHHTLPVVSQILLLLVIPLTVVTLLVSVVRAVRAARVQRFPAT